MAEKKLTFRKPVLVITGEENEELKAPNFFAQKVCLKQFGEMKVSKVINSFIIFDFSSCKNENQINEMKKLYKLIAGNINCMEQKNYVFLGQKEDFQSIKVPKQGIRFFGEELGNAIGWAN